MNINHRIRIKYDLRVFLYAILCLLQGEAIQDGLRLDVRENAVKCSNLLHSNVKLCRQKEILSEIGNRFLGPRSINMISFAIKCLNTCK